MVQFQRTNIPMMNQNTFTVILNFSDARNCDTYVVNLILDNVSCKPQLIVLFQAVPDFLQKTCNYK